MEAVNHIPKSIKHQSVMTLWFVLEKSYVKYIKAWVETTPPLAAILTGYSVLQNFNVEFIAFSPDDETKDYIKID